MIKGALATAAFVLVQGQFPHIKAVHCIKATVFQDFQKGFETCIFFCIPLQIQFYIWI